ncbi:opioid growth factor receptor-like [Megalops cyprinoides]|uniref:opioid growth factor receptor-like n=1 Tax=Megalops cyprinoides TaxID=118141 RepID=UPI0018655F66|nr:opioid growth factor receptor-like [Megalops cyprinoides]
MDNLQFYLNKTPSNPDDVYIDDFHQYWKGRYEKLERVHSYIQWLFPLQEPGINYMAHELTVKEIQAFCNNEEAKQRLLTSYEMMLDFYGITLVNKETGEVKRSDIWLERFENLNRYTHNNLRITRILKCLGELGFRHYQAPLVQFFLEETLVHGNLDRVKQSVLDYFLFAVRDKEQRRKLIEFAFKHYQPRDEFVWCPRKIQKRLLKKVENKLPQETGSSVDPSPQNNREMEHPSSPGSGSLNEESPSKGNTQESGAESNLESEDIPTSLHPTPQQLGTTQNALDRGTKAEMQGSTSPVKDLHNNQEMERSGTTKNTRTAEQEAVREKLKKEGKEEMARGPEGEIPSHPDEAKAGASGSNNPAQHDGGSISPRDTQPYKNSETLTFRSEDADSLTLTAKDAPSHTFTEVIAESQTFKGDMEESPRSKGGAEEGCIPEGELQDSQRHQGGLEGSHRATGGTAESHIREGGEEKSHRTECCIEGSHRTEDETAATQPLTSENAERHRLTGVMSESDRLEGEKEESHTAKSGAAESQPHGSGVEERQRPKEEAKGSHEPAEIHTHKDGKKEVPMPEDEKEKSHYRTEGCLEEGHRPVGGMEKGYRPEGGAANIHRFKDEIEVIHKLEGHSPKRGAEERPEDGTAYSQRPEDGIVVTQRLGAGAEESHKHDVRTEECHGSEGGAVDSQSCKGGTEESHKHKDGAEGTHIVQGGAPERGRSVGSTEESHRSERRAEESDRFEGRAEESHRHEDGPTDNQMGDQSEKLWASQSDQGSGGQIGEALSMQGNNRDASPECMICENSDLTAREDGKEKTGDQDQDQEEPMDTYSDNTESQMEY